MAPTWGGVRTRGCGLLEICAFILPDLKNKLLPALRQWLTLNYECSLLGLNTDGYTTYTVVKPVILEQKISVFCVCVGGRGGRGGGGEGIHSKGSACPSLRHGITVTPHGNLLLKLFVYFVHFLVSSPCIICK